MTKHWMVLVTATLATLHTLFASAPLARADIYQWEYINPANPSLGKQQSTTLAPDGAGVDAVPGASLSSRNLSMAYLIGADLTGAQAGFTDLANADVSQANLTNADLNGSYLTGANLTGAEVRGATFSLGFDYDTATYIGGITAAQLYSTASYQTHDLTGIRLDRNNLAGVNLAGQNLTNTGFLLAALTSANLSQANLTNANLSAATLTGANLTGAEVRGANLRHTGLTAAQLSSTASYQAHDLTGIGLQGNNLAGVNLAGQNLTNADFIFATLTNANFNESNLANAKFSYEYGGANLTDANLSGANLTNAYFAGSVGCGEESCGIFNGAYLYGANLSGTDARGAQFQYATLIGANLSQANLQNANFSDDGSSFVATFLTNANLSGADARGANFQYATLGGANTSNLIKSNGRIAGLNLTAGASLVVRDYDGNPAVGPPIGPLPIVVDQHLAMDTTGTLRLVFDADPWNSTISFAPGIPVARGGTLELTFASDVNLPSQIGRTIDLFDWAGVAPTGTFTISSPYAWDLSNLYTTGEVTLVAAPSLPGDFNHDGAVDAADYIVWRKNFNGDQTKYDAWRANFGQSFSFNGAGASSIANPSVPEPSAGPLLFAAGLWLRRRRTAEQIL